MKKKKQKKQERKQGKLRILAVGDLHGDTLQALKLAKEAERKNVDLVILCGDLTYADATADYLVGPFAKAGKKILLVPGNHESIATANFLEEKYKAFVKNIHGKGIEKQGVAFFGSGGASIGPFPLLEKEISYALKKGFEKIKKAKKKIMITHAHPYGTLMGKLTRVFAGSEAVSEAIKKFKPNVVLCSHVHEAEGIEERIGKTKVINVGRKGKIIEI